MKTIYFHIGTPKTGSTTIQSFLFENHHELREYGLNYPNHTSLIPATGAMTRYANGSLLANTYNKPAEKKKALDIYRKEIAASDADKSVISEEGLFLIPETRFFDELRSDGFELKFIVYLRKSFEYLCSFWSEMCRLHEVERTYIKYPTPLEQFLIEDNLYIEGLKRIHQLGDQYGDDNIIVRPFEPASFKDNDLLNDFLSIFQIPMTDRFKRIHAQNESRRSRKMLDVINLLQVANTPGSFLHDVSKPLTDPKDIDDDYDILLHSVGGHLSAEQSISDELIKDVTAKYSSYESMIAKRFLNKDSLFIHTHPGVYKSNRERYSGLSSEDLTRVNIFVQNKIYTQQPFYHRWLRKLYQKSKGT